MHTPTQKISPVLTSLASSSFVSLGSFRCSTEPIRPRCPSGQTAPRFRYRIGFSTIIEVTSWSSLNPRLHGQRLAGVWGQFIRRPLITRANVESLHYFRREPTSRLATDCARPRRPCAQESPEDVGSWPETWRKFRARFRFHFHFRLPPTLSLASANAIFRPCPAASYRTPLLQWHRSQTIGVGAYTDGSRRWC